MVLYSYEKLELREIVDQLYHKCNFHFYILIIKAMIKVFYKDFY